MTRRCAPRHGEDGGFSLVELVVAMSVASLVLISLSVVFTAALRGSVDVQDKTTTNAEVRLAADVMARRLRVATPASATSPAFLTMTPGEVSFTASIQDEIWLATPGQAAQDPPLTTVTYRLDETSGCLTETLAAAGTSPRTTCLLRGASAASTVLTYYAAASGPATTAQPAAVRSVGLTISASTRGTTGRTATSTVSSRVVCANTVPRGS